MSREQQPGYGWQAPSGGWQTGGPPPAPAPGGGGGGSSHRAAWIGAGATLLAAVVTVSGAYVVNSRNTAPSSPPSAAQAPQTSSTPSGAAQDPETPSASSNSPAAAPPASPSQPAAPTAKASGTVRWEGALVIAYAEDRDLDLTPPVRAEVNSDNDFSVFQFTGRMLRPEGGAKALVWADAGKVPSYADCAAVVDTQATGKDMAMKTGMVVCGKTDKGRVVRLTVKELAGQASDTRGTFDVVVWNKD